MRTRQASARAWRLPRRTRAGPGRKPRTSRECRSTSACRGARGTWKCRRTSPPGCRRPRMGRRRA
eukprot:12937589-Prorocentrum_lima.AAC.1